LNIWVNPSTMAASPCGPQSARVMCAPGDDNNDGLDPSTPLQHLQRAFNWVVDDVDLRSLQGACSQVIIYVADGEVTSSPWVPVLTANGWPPGLCDGPHFQIIGNIYNPEAVTIHGQSADAISAGSPAGGVSRFMIRGFRLRTTGPLYT